MSSQKRLRKPVIRIQNLYILKMPVEWLLLSVSIFQAFQDAANFSWLAATLGFTQLTSIPLSVPHALGSLGSPKEDSAKAMAFAGSGQGTGRSARALTSRRVCGRRGGEALLSVPEASLGLPGPERARRGGTLSGSRGASWSAPQPSREPQERARPRAPPGGPKQE